MQPRFENFRRGGFMMVLIDFVQVYVHSVTVISPKTILFMQNVVLMCHLLPRRPTPVK